METLINIGNKIVLSNRDSFFDTNIPTAAYSLRSLRSPYYVVCEVVRDSDNAVRDFVGAELTNGELESWVGSGNNAYVRTWYDQSGNGNHAVQTSASSQPKIWDSSTGLVTEGGRPALDFDGSDDLLEVPSSTGSFKYLHDGTTSAVFGVVTFGKVANPDAVYMLMGNSDGASANVGVLIGYDDRSSISRNDANYVVISKGSGGNYVSVDITSDTITPAEQKLMFYFLDTDASASDRTQTGIDGGILFGNNTQTNAPVTSDATYNLQIGANGNDGSIFTGYVQEIIFYNTDQSANRTGIETNINDYYSIYSTSSVPDTALTYNGEPITFNGDYICFNDYYSIYSMLTYNDEPITLNGDYITLT